MKIKIPKKKFISFSKFEEIFSLDLRSLGLARVALSFLVILDFLVRLSDFKAFYTDEGVMPATYLFSFLNENFITVQFITGLEAVTLIWFIVGIAAAICLLVGYKTKLANIVVWVVLITVHGRNPLVLQAGDVLFRMLFFWGMFLPWGDAFSIDSSKNKKTKIPVKVFSTATIAYMLQLTMMYFFGVIWKSGKEWRSEGTAVYFALSIDQFVTPVGHLLLKLPYNVLKMLTHLTLLFEAFGPILIFLPIKRPSIRTFAVIGFMIMHLGFGLGLSIGNFSYIVIFGFIALLPSEFWEYLSQISKRFNNKLREKLQNIINPKFLDSSTINNQKKYFFIEIIVAVILVYVFLWNIDGLNNSPINISREAKIPAFVLRFDQKWDMFSPYPLRNDGWYVIEGHLNNGQTVDIFNKDNEYVSYTKPKWVYKIYKNNRWRKYMMNLSQGGREEARGYYANYLCKEWNENNEIKMKDVKIIFMEEITLPDFQYSRPTAEVLLEYECI